MSRLQRLFQAAVFGVLVRPILRVLLGLHILNPERVPRRGPALLVANHNSHLDTLALMSLVPLRDLWKLRPVAAADHFGGGILGFVARHVLRTVLVARDGRGPEAALEPVLAALECGDILIFFPEGSRGEPETMAPFKRAIAHHATCRPDVPIIPAYIRGMGKTLPKGELLFVPFSCEVVVGEAMDLQHVPTEAIPERLRARVEELSRQTALSGWDEEAGHGLGDGGPRPSLNRANNVVRTGRPR